MTDAGILWGSVKGFCNSVFFTSIIGSLAGAFAGAYGGQRIVARGKEREELIKEIRNTSAATVVSLAICNVFTNIKQQHVKPMKESFDAQKAALFTHLRSRRCGELPPDTAFPFTADFRSLFLPIFPIDTLRRLIFEGLSLDKRRPLMLVTGLDETIHGLNTSIENRNRLIASYKATDHTGNQLLHLYFGLPQGERRITNEEYPSSVDAIYRQTDDGIFFSKLLCDDLVDHNINLSAQYRKAFKQGAPVTIDKPDFTKIESAGLMPNEADYTDWLNLFAKPTKLAQPHRRSLLAAVRRKLTRGT